MLAIFRKALNLSINAGATVADLTTTVIYGHKKLRMLVPHEKYLPQQPNTLAYSCYFLSQISIGEVC